MTFEQLMNEPRHLLLKCVSGSKAYNLALPTSDTDIKGVFVLPQQEFYGLTYTPQVNNESNDEVFFEVERFVELLTKNNPNILELLSTPQDCILYRHPLMDLIRPEDFLSKLCLDTFAGYARSQIKKARGLNKKINRSFEKERKLVIDFCWVVKDKRTIGLVEWLRLNGLKQENCGLTQLDHFRDAYLVYAEGRGIVSSEEANDVSLSVMDRNAEPLGVLYFNKDAYSIYCKEYAEYWQWVGERNEERYQSTMAHGQQYDAKNMMHTIRLLSMAEEIARGSGVVVKRADREFLLGIRSGRYTYDELMGMADERMERIAAAYAVADLPDMPDMKEAEVLLVRLREAFYTNGWK